jgi:pimeloyl-ACP methyl ester carboxylesterase
MKRKGLFITLGILLVLAVTVSAGPKPHKPQLNKELPALSIPCEKVGAYVDAIEAGMEKVKPMNASKVHYFNDSLKNQTDYAILYLHGFSASPMEGYPVHVNLAQEFGMNIYIPRLPTHGQDLPEPLLDMTGDTLWNAAKEALVLAHSLGKKVIVVGCSTGGTLSLKLAAEYPDMVEALILYAPLIKMANKASWLLARPFGLQIGRMVMGGKYRVFEPNPKTDPYWYAKYRLEGIVQLRILMETTMKAKTFKAVTQPVFLGYYYRDEEHQDNTSSVDGMKWMFANLGTPVDKKIDQSFSEATEHVIACEFTNPNWKQVLDASASFLQGIVGIKKAGN